MSSLQAFFFKHAALFALVATRIAGFVVTSPFPGQNVAASQRVTLFCVLTWLASTFAPEAGLPATLDLSLVARGVLELGCGLLIGLAFYTVFFIADVTGATIGQATGLGSPSVLNPTLEAPDTVVGRIVTLCAMLVALAAGVHRVALAALLESFRAVPVGQVGALDGPMLGLVDLWVASFASGVRLAVPVVVVTLLVQLSLAIVSRSAPSLQIFSVGFTLLLASGIAVMLVGLDDSTSGFAAHFGRLAGEIDHAVTALRP